MDQRFEGVPDTLFIPLWARIEASKRFPELLFDQRALALEPALAGRALAGTTSEFNLLSSAVRAHVMDAMAEDFIAAHGPSTLIVLGCGLDTASSRIDGRGSVFFELDLPDVIAYRRQVLGEDPDEHLIARDLFDLAWTDAVPHDKPILIYAAGVSMGRGLSRSCRISGASSPAPSSFSTPWTPAASAMQSGMWRRPEMLLQRCILQSTMPLPSPRRQASP